MPATKCTCRRTTDLDLLHSRCRAQHPASPQAADSDEWAAAQTTIPAVIAPSASGNVQGVAGTDYGWPWPIPQFRGSARARHRRSKSRWGRRSQ